RLRHLARRTEQRAIRHAHDGLARQYRPRRLLLRAAPHRRKEQRAEVLQPRRRQAARRRTHRNQLGHTQKHLTQGGGDARRHSQLDLSVQPLCNPGVEDPPVGLPNATRRRHPLPRSEAELTSMTRFFTNQITRFLVRRLISSLVVLFGALVVVFALVHLVPGDPLRIALGTRYTPEAYAALRSASGLDRPLIEQFFSYAGSALTGDLGVSFRNGDPVRLRLLDRLPATISLAIVGIVIALLISVPAGIWAALREGRLSDAIVRICSQFGLSIPDFWMATLLIGLFA